MAVKEKNIWILLIFILSGLVVGGLLGSIAEHVTFLEWLGYGEEFGLTSPLDLDLSIIKISFAIRLKINIASIIGLILSIFIYKKI